jgi:hypothetical protein
MRLSVRRGSYGVDAPYMLIVPFAAVTIARAPSMKPCASCAPAAG